MCSILYIIDKLLYIHIYLHPNFSMNSYPLDVPDQVNSSSINVTIISFFAVQITWAPPNNNFALDQTYNYTYNTQTVAESSAKSNEPFIVLELNPNLNYALSISSCNIVGCGPFSGDVTFSTITSGTYYFSSIIVNAFLK